MQFWNLKLRIRRLRQTTTQNLACCKLFDKEILIIIDQVDNNKKDDKNKRR